MPRGIVTMFDIAKFVTMPAVKVITTCGDIIEIPGRTLLDAIRQFKIVAVIE